MQTQRILTTTVKELRQMSRDRKLYPLLFLAPIIQLIILGYAATFDIKNISTAVLDRDQTQMSRQYLHRFQHNGYFTVSEQLLEQNRMHRLLDRGKAVLGIEIPEGFEEKLKEGKLSPVQIIVDGTESNAATIALNYARIISEKFSSRLVLKQIDLPSFQSGVLDTLRQNRGESFFVGSQTRLWYNPNLSSPDFMVPGVICMILLLVTTNLTAISIVKENEIGTLEQLLVSPLRSSELIIGKLLPFIFIGFIDVIFVLTIGHFIFQMPVRGNLALLLLLSLFYLLSTLGLGIFISTIVQTQEQSMIITFLIILTMNILSGVFFPIANMPQAIQYLTYLMPLRYFAIIVRGILLRGTGIGILWPQVSALSLLGILTLLFSIKRLRKKLQ